MSYSNELYPNKISNLFPKEIVKIWLNERREITFKRGEIINKPQHLSGYVFLLKGGSARIFHIHEDGKECIIGLLAEGDFVELLNIFSDKENIGFAKALTDVKVVAVSKEEIRLIVKKTPELAIALLEFFSKKIQEIIEILEQVAYGKVEERLLHLFKKIADTNKGDAGWYPIPTSITHQDIAGMIASTRETVTLLINKLIHVGVLKQYENMLWINLQLTN